MNQNRKQNLVSINLSLKFLNTKKIKNIWNKQKLKDEVTTGSFLQSNKNSKKRKVMALIMNYSSGTWLKIP